MYRRFSYEHSPTHRVENSSVPGQLWLQGGSYENMYRELLHDQGALPGILQQQERPCEWYPRAHEIVVSFDTSNTPELNKFAPTIRMMTLLPKRTKEGYNVLFSKLMDGNSEHFDYNNHLKTADMTVSLNLAQLGTSPGFVAILDSEGYSLGHVMKTNITSMKKFSYYQQVGIV